MANDAQEGTVQVDSVDKVVEIFTDGAVGNPGPGGCGLIAL